MNSLKPLLVLAILGGIGYWVYQQIHGQSSGPPPGAEDVWNATAPQVVGPSGSGFDGPPDGNPWSEGAGLPDASREPPSTAITARESEEPFGNGLSAYQVEPSQPAANVSPSGPSGHTSGAIHDPGLPAPADLDASVGIPLNQDSYGQPLGTSPPHLPGVAGNAVETESVSRGVSPASDDVARQFAEAFKKAERLLDQAQLAEAHYQLSLWYDRPGLTVAQQRKLKTLLDQLAGTVVYSTRGYLDELYVVRPNDSLEEIARQHQVPWQLLAKINGLHGPDDLKQGERIKVVRGPFSATVNLGKQKLTLMLNGSYAGSFDIGVGTDAPPHAGPYQVVRKELQPAYQAAARTIPGGDASNPLGKHQLVLDNQVSIHGTNDPANIGKRGLPGSIILKPRDAEDLFDILVVGSKVTVHR